MKKNFFYAGGLSLLLWGMAACSGQGKADKAAVVADSVVVKRIVLRQTAQDIL